MMPDQPVKAIVISTYKLFLVIRSLIPATFNKKHKLNCKRGCGIRALFSLQDEADPIY
jgi:hypothetical protein